jgi:glycerate 2-kinase
MTPREHLMRILSAALEAVDPAAAVRRDLRFDGGRLEVGGREAARLEEGSRIVVLAAGKAARGMAAAALEVLGTSRSEGVAAVPHALVSAIPGLEVYGAGHPYPDAGSLAAAGESLRLARGLEEGDLLLCLLSGGASSLWTAPPDGVALAEIRTTSESLMRAGAGIGELNTVRKQLSRIAGGRLARVARPARVVTLALSDVVGAPPATIGSGPTVAGDTGYADALDVLARHRVDVPAAVLRHLQRGAAGEIPREVDAGADGDVFHLLGDLDAALDGARAEAERLGYRGEIVAADLAGEARAAGADIAAQMLAALRSGEGMRALIWGGETTVAVRGDGRGGRSQELALSAARVLEGEDRIVVLACGTDGIDGPTPAAGAIVDGGTIARARTAGLDPDDALTRNDAYPLLRATGDLVVTGPTGTNVGDLVVGLTGPMDGSDQTVHQ